MATFTHPQFPDAWEQSTAPESLHYYGCACGSCASAAANKAAVIQRPDGAGEFQTDAAALPPGPGALLYSQDWRWNADSPHGTAINLTFSFMSTNPGVYGGFRVFSEADKAGAREALAEWSKVCNVTFTEVSTGGQIAFGNANIGGATGMTLWQGVTGASSGLKTTHADIYMTSTSPQSYGDGGFGMRAMLHEIGHALGLKHTFDTSGTTLSGVENTAQYSVMSYNNSPGTPNAQPFTPQLYDIAAVQYLYGANQSFNSGDTVYSFAPDKASVMTIWDGGGSDTVDASNQTVNCVLDLREGQFSSLGTYNGALAKNVLCVAYGATIERATGGSGADTIIGNDTGNVLTGGLGRDILTGGGGSDVFHYASSAEGGDTISDFTSGTDRLEFDAAAFGNTLSAGDFAALATAYTGTNAGGARFVFDGNDDLWFDANGAAAGGTTRMATLNGASLSASDIHLAGAVVTPAPTPMVVTGTSGNDILSGTGGEITMKGGTGSDTYILDSTGDKAVEYSGQGVDTIRTSLGCTLGTYMENLILTGNNAVKGTGSLGHNQITGNDAANTLSGMAGNDTLNGKGGNDVLVGGSGQDVLTGGSGADQFRFLATGDVTWVASNIAKGTAKADTITDFVAGTDKIWFDDSQFRLAAGTAKDGISFVEINSVFQGTNSTASDFAVGKASLVQDSTGTVYYDPNGKGAGYYVVATLQAGTHLHGSDIIIA